MADRDRRNFLSGAMASLGLMAAGAGRFVREACHNRQRRRLCHPGAFAESLTCITISRRPACGLAAVEGPSAPAAREHDVDAGEIGIEDMDKGGVASAMVSITNPGLWFGGQGSD